MLCAYRKCGISAMSEIAAFREQVAQLYHLSQLTAYQRLTGIELALTGQFRLLANHKIMRRQT
jgi:hypothetical protein